MAYTAETDNTADILDSRDIDSRIAELEDRVVECDCGPHVPGVVHYPFCSIFDEEVNYDPLDEDEEEELARLIEFREDCQNYTSEWEYGATMIRESYWITYAQDFAADIGALDHEAGWPSAHIDWEGAARDLAMDYSEVSYDGVDYYIR